MQIDWRGPLIEAHSVGCVFFLQKD